MPVHTLVVYIEKSVHRHVVQVCLILCLVCYVCACVCSGSLYGALEETTDATQLYLGPDRIWRGGGGEATPQITYFTYIPKDTHSQGGITEWEIIVFPAES